MIKESKIKDLVYNKVAGLLEIELVKYKFKYLKSKQYFLRQDNDYNQIIYLRYPHSPLRFDERTDQLFLLFTISSSIKIPDFEKWYIKKIGEGSQPLANSEPIISQIELSLDDFDLENFYNPTAAQKFKKNVTLALTNGNQNPLNVISFNELMTIIPDYVSDLLKKSDIIKLFESRKYPLEHTFLLFYGGYIDLAKIQLTKTYHYYLEEIEQKQKTSAREANLYIERFNKFIQAAQSVAQISYTNPFNRSIEVTPSKGEKFHFSLKTKFIECLRLDISMFEIKEFYINSHGEVFFLINDNKIIKVNSKGEILFEKEIDNKTKNGYFYFSNSGIIPETNEFYINNSILTSQNELIEFDLKIPTPKNGKLSINIIKDIAFSSQRQKYIILYENNLLIYSLDKKLESSLVIEQGDCFKIITNKEWIISKRGDSIIVILDFKGQIINTYEYSKSNHLCSFSKSLEHMVCYFYSTKSQYFDLNKNKKATLWAHPTYVKGYKEIMYNDIENNFGMDIAAFSPDSKYIVGGAYHGKYVAWTLPKLERIELLPKFDSIEYFKTYQMSHKIAKPEFIELEGQIFLKNRANVISNIIFFEDGDIFLTEIHDSKLLLLWDRDFNNLSFQQVEGNIALHSEKYLTQRTATELIIYEQI